MNTSEDKRRLENVMDMFYGGALNEPVKGRRNLTAIMCNEIHVQRRVVENLIAELEEFDSISILQIIKHRIIQWWNYRKQKRVDSPLRH